VTLRCARVLDLQATGHTGTDAVTTRLLAFARHRAKRGPATRRRPDDDPGKFDSNRVVHQARVQRALADCDGAWPAVGQAVEVGPIDGIVLDQRKSGRLDVDPTGRIDHGIVPGDEPGRAALLAHVIVAQVDADRDVQAAPGVDHIVLDRDVV